MRLRDCKPGDKVRAIRTAKTDHGVPIIPEVLEQAEEFVRQRVIGKVDHIERGIHASGHDFPIYVIFPDGREWCFQPKEVEKV